MRVGSSALLRSRLVGRVRLATAVVMLIASGMAMPARAESVSAARVSATATNAVTNWNGIAISTLIVIPPPAGGAPPALQVNLAMVQGAVYDAINAIEPRHQPYLLETSFASTASKDAAVATAAYRVLSNIVATVPSRIPFPDSASLVQQLDAEYAAALDVLPDGQAKTDGIAAGTAAAEAIMAAREGDGRFGPSPWVAKAETGHWQPLLNPDGTQCSTRLRGSRTCDRS
jgi:hypothetical protein